MKRLSFVACSVLLGALLVVASLWFVQTKAAAGNTAQSAVPPLFTDDFEVDASKWVTESNTCANIIADGATHVYSVTNCPGSTARSIVTETTVPGSTKWTDYIVQARVKVVTGTGSYYPMLLARYKDARNYYFLTLRGDNGQVAIRRYYNGSSSGRQLTGTVTNVVSVGVWYTAALELKGNSLRAFINGTPVLTATDTSAEAFFTGTIGFGAYQSTGWLDDVVVSPIAATLNVTKLGLGDGLVTSVPAGINCGVTCTADFVQGTVVTLTATPITGTSFGGWGGACLNPGTVIVPGIGQLPVYQCVIPMTSALEATVTFNKYYLYLPIVFRQS
jgi:hypothetical protein